MSQLRVCSKGHQWETTVELGAASPTEDTYCPVCGSSTMERTPPASEEADGDSFHSGEGDFVIPPPVQAAERPLPQIEGYEILGELGRGGMGVVYKARQLGLGRIVAVKMIKNSMLAGPDEVARFRVEAEAVARLQHANIVQIFEVGEQKGLPYFALEFLEGDSLDRKLGGTPMAAKPAALLIETLALAMHVAHQKGIVHRDLKPANVLLTADGTPKITDFGLAKRLETPSGLTPTDAIMGSPSYMAPEQASGKSKHIGPAADIYALGAMLYEMLTGRPPFLAETPVDTVLLVLTQEPVPPARLQPKVPRDLETICLKCLNKDPRKRYADAEALADDLRRFREERPILARPVGRVERGWRWCRRNPVVAGLLAALILVFQGGFSGVVFEWRDALTQSVLKDIALGEAKENAIEAKINAIEAENNAKNEKIQKERAINAEGVANERRVAAETARSEKEDVNYFQGIDLADRDWFDNNIPQSRKRLDNLLPGADGADRRRWEWHYLSRRFRSIPDSLAAHMGPVLCMAFRPDIKFVTGGYDGTLKLWHKEEGKSKPTPHLLKGHTGTILSLAFSPDPEGRYLVSASKPGYGERGFGEAFVWDLTDMRKPKKLPYRDVNSVVFHPKGKLIALGCEDGTIKVWDWTAEKEKFSLSLLDKDDQGRVNSVAFSPDGKRLAAVGWYGLLGVWDVESGKRLYRIQAHEIWANAVAFSSDPQGSLIATSGRDRTVKIWHAESGAPLRTLWGHTRDVKSLAFHPKFAVLATASEDKTVRLWQVDTGEELYRLRGHIEGVDAVAFTPDGDQVAAGDGSGAVKMWQWQQNQEALAWPAGRNHVYEFAMSPDGRKIAAVGSDFKDATIKIWDPRTGKLTFTFNGHVGDDKMMPFCVAFSPDGKHAASGSKPFSQIPERKGQLLVWELETGKIVKNLAEKSGGAARVAYSPDGRYLAWTNNETNKVQLWDLKEDKEADPLETEAGTTGYLTFSRDGKYLAVVSSVKFLGISRSQVTVWDFPQGKIVQTFKKHKGFVLGLAFSPDNQKLASSGGDREQGEVNVWNLETGKAELTLQGKTGAFNDVTFHRDGTRLATAGQDGVVRIWETTHGRQVLTLNHRGDVARVAFSPDGDLLAAVGGDMMEPAEMRVWDGTAGDKKGNGEKGPRPANAPPQQTIPTP